MGVMRIRDFWSVLKQAFKEWNAGNVSRLGAALAYYSVFSIPPLLILVLAIASRIFGEEAAQQGIMRELENPVGPQVAHAVGQVLPNTSDPASSVIAAIVGIVVLFAGAAAMPLLAGSE